MMRNETLVFPHPFDRLELYDLDPAQWDYAIPPELFLVGDPALVPPVPYMPPLWRVEVERKENQVESHADGQFDYSFKLTCQVNELWQACFEKHRGPASVTFDGDRMILHCAPEDLQESYDEICHRAVPRATKDYREERDKLVWRVFEKMKEQERRDRIETEIQTELGSLKQEQRQRVLAAQENGWSVPFVVQNFNDRYREILENKFNWWGRILDGVTVRKNRALFELELLAV